MSTSTNLHAVDPRRVGADHYEHGRFLVVKAHDDDGNTVTLFFHPDENGDELDAAETWLLEALAKVTEAKVAAAKKQQDPLPFAAIGEPIDLGGRGVGWARSCGAEEPAGYVCTLDRGHTGSHQAHGPDDAVYAQWDNLDLTAVDL